MFSSRVWRGAGIVIVFLVALIALARAQSNPFKYNGLSYTSTGVTFANLGSTPPQANTLVYCTDCQQTTVCVGNGAGAWAKNIAGVWKCTDTTVTGSVTDPLLLNSLTGTGVTPNIAGYNGQRQGEINLMAYGASGLGVNVTTATGTATQNTITVASASGWTQGQGIIVHHAGATVTLSTPGAPTVTSVCTGTCATTFTYKVAALTAKRGITVAGAGGSTTTSGAALSGTVYNRIKWSAVASAWGYAVYRTAPTNALIAVTSGTAAVDTGGTASGAIESFAELPSAAPGSSLADWLQTTVSGINGTTFTLGATLTNSITSQQISHDDTTPITNAFNAAATAGKLLYVPQGVYFFCGTPLNGASINIAGVPQGSIIETCDNQYTILETSNLNNVSNSIRNVVFAGGLGTYHNTSLATTTSPLYSFEVDYTKFVDFTGLAWGIEPGDSPRNKLDHCFFQALDESKSIGVVIPNSHDNQVLNSQFQNVRIAVKLPGSVNAKIARDTFLSTLPISNPLAPRVGVWIVPTNDTASAFGLDISDNKFGNENLASQDVRVAVLDDDTTGSDESTHMPLYATADDAAITTTTLTSAAECPFTSAMCQGGAGCTGAAGNWPVLIEGALSTASNKALTTTITAFTNTCSVTVGNTADTAVTGQVARMAPSDSTNTAKEFVVANNTAFSNGYAGLAFLVSSLAGVGGANVAFTHNIVAVGTIVEQMPVTARQFFNLGDWFDYNRENAAKTNNDAAMVVGPNVANYGTNSDDVSANAQVNQFAANHSNGSSIIQTICASGATNDAFEVVDKAGNILGTVTCDGGIKPATTAFASLGTPGNGIIKYCSDCTVASPCASGGNGAIAKRLNGAWVCN